MARMAAAIGFLVVCPPDTLPAWVVLEACEIDSSSVTVGAFVEVAYGKGERDPVSGAGGAEDALES